MNKEAWLSDMLKLHSRYTRAEAYTINEEIMDVGMKYQHGDKMITQAGVVLYQNSPNPFIDYTTIAFELPEAMSAVLTIMDISGQVVKQIKGDYSKGYHRIEIKAEDLSGSGVLYYQLQTEDYLQVKHIIFIN